MVVARLGIMGSARTISCPAGVFTGDVSGDSIVFDPIIYAHTHPFARDYGTGDPLVMSITTPVTVRQFSDLPVVVVVHGGRYESGSYDEPWWDGTALARNNVITVSVNYRLSLAGFVPFADDEPFHFRGVDDVAQALSWLQENMESFGGDPTNITVLGHSAGAGVALWLCRKDHYQGLFRRVVALSPSFPSQPFLKKKAKLRRILGKPITRKALSALPAKKLQRGYQRFSRSIRMDIAVGAAPFAAYELADVPILLSCTREEMLDMPIAKRIDSSWWSRLVLPVIRRQLGANNAYSPPFAARSCGYLIGDCMIRRFVLAIADSAPYNSWLMEHRGTVTAPKKHCDDIAWVLGHGERQHPVFNEFLSFVRNGSVSWPQYGKEKTALVYQGEQPEITSDPLAYLREGLR